MGWIFLAESELSPLLWSNGLGRLPIVRENASLKQSFFHVWDKDGCRSLQSGPTLEHLGAGISWTEEPPPLTSLSADFHARTSALRELELAWRESEADSSLSICASFANWDHNSSSWKTCQQSFLGDLEKFSEPWPTWGTTQDGRAFQQARLEPFILENDGTYLPTPTACDYGKNVGRKSDGITPSGRDRWSLTVRARRGELPFHPKGVLNPEWIEQAMDLPIGWTAIEDWAMPFIAKPRRKRSCA